jgi:hypothetical protein
MKWRTLPPMILIVLPAAALVSMGCGILLFPFEAPKVAAVNSELLSFSVDIVDDADQPPNDVTVKIAEKAIAVDLLFVETGESKPQPPTVANGAFTYTTFGNYAVVVEYSKAGYQTATYVYSFEDHVVIVDRAMLTRIPTKPTEMEQINTFKQPHSKIILKKAGS